MNKLKAFWNSLPHAAQAVIVLFAATAAGSVANAINQPGACTSLSCIGHYAKAGLSTGIAAVAGLYMKSSLYSR